MSQNAFLYAVSILFSFVGTYTAVSCWSLRIARVVVHCELTMAKQLWLPIISCAQATLLNKYCEHSQHWCRIAISVGGHLFTHLGPRVGQN